jgi:tripartite-type tricarboxylate transporter receptor subunit TctC
MKPYWRMVSCLQKPVIILLLTMSPASIQATVAQDYPSRPITMIVPHAPAAGVDILARILAEGMKTTLRQAIVVENMPAGAGTVGAGRLAEAAPDGYTIGVGDQTSFVISSVTTSVRYDVLKDFEPIALLSTSPVALIARKTMQAPDLKGLIAWLKTTPEGATAGSFGQGSGPNIISAAFQSLTGTKLRMVTYRGNAPALQDVVSGQIDLLFAEQASIVGHFRSGTIKAYAMLAKKRSAVLPEIPTIEEAGGPPLHIVTWRGMWVPRGTPAHISKRLGSAVVEALSDPAVQKQIAEAGQEVVPLDQQTPQALAAHHKAELDKWMPMIKAANVKAD